MTSPLLSSLTIFFPFYNDAGTVEKAIHDAYTIGRQVTTNLEVIALHGGASKDDTYAQILAQRRRYPRLKIIDKKNNQEGYAVIKYGLKAATKDWVFYTDGDLQYSVKDLLLLVKKQKETSADIVNGYKIERKDSHRRIFMGRGYQWFSRCLFQLPIRDTDCDFRLIRRSVLQKITLRSVNASILPELIKKLSWAGAQFAEVPVFHGARQYGQSNYSLRRLLGEKIVGDIRLWWELRRE